MPTDLEEKIRSLSPGAMAILKRQIATMPEQERQRLTSRLRGIAELSDITGTPQLRQQTLTRKPQEEVPLWQKGLNVFSAPFEWVGEHITKPFGAYATAPFTPTTEGTEGMNWWERERKEYKNWQEPVLWKTPWGYELKPVKGIVESAPWFAMPGLTVGGALGGAALKGGVVGALSKAGKAGKITGTALKYTPWGLAEIGAGKVIGAVTKPLVRKLAPAVKATKGLTKEDVESLSKMSPALQELHVHPARLKGFKNVPKEQIADYLEKLKAQAKGNKEALQDIEAASAANEYGGLREAVLASEKGISRLHDEELAISGGKTALLELQRAIKKVLELPKELSTVKTGKSFTSKIYRGVPKPGEEGLPAAEYGTTPLGYHTTSEEIAQWYAKEGGRIIEGEVTLRNPYVITEGIEDKYLLGVVKRARKKAELEGKDAVQVEQAARDAIPSALTKKGYDGLLVNRKEGYLEVIPYKTEGLSQKTIKTTAPAVKGTAKAPPKPPKPPPTATGVPPEPPLPPKPPRITQGVPGGIPEPAGSALDKITSLIRISKPLRFAQEAIYTQERALRTKKFAQVLKGKEGEAAFKEARKELTGQYPKVAPTEGFEAIREKVTQAEIDSLFNVIKGAKYHTNPVMQTFGQNNTAVALQKVFLGEIPQEAELKLLEFTFGPEFVREITKKMSLGKKIWAEIVDVLNMPRALLSSGDISGLLRQGGILATRHPMEAFKSVEPMIAAMFSDRREALMDGILRARPRTQLFIDSGGYLAPKAGQITAKLSEHEEAFMSKFMSRIGFVRASNRAYITGLNDMRSRMWERTLDMWEKGGMLDADGRAQEFIAKGMGLKEARKVAREAIDTDYTELAKLINFSTGRGTLGAMNRSGGLLNAMFFSPRLIASRLQFPTMIASKSKLVRVEAMKTMGTFLGIGGSILTAMKLSGQAEVELDPRSADFGKLKVGNTRYDIWTGYAQYIRFMAQLAASERKTEGGRIIPVRRDDLIWRFAQTKFSPAAGLVNDLIQGQTFMGEDFPPNTKGKIAEQVYQRLAPLAIQDMIDGFVQEGLLGGFMSLSSFSGVGVITYTDELKRAQDKAAKERYNMTWDEIGQKYGRLEQIKLSQGSPELIKAEQIQDSKFAAQKPSTMQRWLRDGESIENTFRDAINLAAKEFRDTQDGRAFREKINYAQATRRTMYGARAKKDEYKDIVGYYTEPLKPEQIAKMNPGDVARRDYTQMMFAPDMYDQYGNYNFERAEKKQADFLAMYGQDVMNYIDEYHGAQWKEKPAELTFFEQTKEVLKPYWEITDYVWSLYPSELKTVSDEIYQLERTDPETARRILRRYPTILRARDMIVKLRQRYRLANPQHAQLLRMFYQ